MNCIKYFFHVFNKSSYLVIDAGRLLVRRAMKKEMAKRIREVEEEIILIPVYFCPPIGGSIDFCFVYNILNYWLPIFWFKHFQPMVYTQKLLGQPRPEVLQLDAKA